MWPWSNISGAGFDTRFELLAHHEYPYPRAVRRAVLAAMNAGRASVADLARLNFLLGELYASAVLATQKKAGVKVELVGCHGQTLYHQGEPAPYLGKKIAATWQTGEGAIIAARVGAPVVSDFRPADMAAGGKGAPLVPFLDYLVYRDAARRPHCAEPRRNRQPDGHPRRRIARAGGRLRHRPGKHGDRRRHGAPLRQAL